MAKTKKGNSAKGNAKKVAPIKVEKIVDEPSSSKKEVFAIIIGILVVAALVVGSVIYFKGDKDPLTKNNDKKDNIVDVEDDVLDLLEEEKEEDKEEKKTYVQQVSNTVKKECTSCTIVVLEPYIGTVNKNHVDYTEDVKDQVIVGSKNETKATVYYTDEENTYQIVIDGSIKATEEEVINMVALTIDNAVNKVARDKEMTENETEGFKESILLDQNSSYTVKDYEEEKKENGIIVVTSEDTSLATHGIAIRIEVEDKVDWSKGVTVNGTTYNESVLNEDNEEPYTYQDEEGINIILGVTEKDLGEKAENAPIEFDVKYTTQKGEEKEDKYEVDLTEVVIEYEKKEDYEDEDEACTKEDIENINSMLEQIVTNVETEADSYLESQTSTSSTGGESNTGSGSNAPTGQSQENQEA